MHLIKFFIILFIYFTAVVTQNTKKLPVGAIFKSTEDEGEIAFRTAIENSNNIKERNFELIPIIKYSKTDDGLTLEKLACELVAEGVIAIFGSPSSKSGSIIAAICHTLEIPHIMYEYKKQIKNYELPFHSMSINVHPNDLKLANAYAAIIKSLSWDRYAIIYETEKELIQLQDVLQIHGPESRSVVIRKLPSNTLDFRQFLKNLRELKIPCFVINCATENIFGLMKQAHELHMLGEYQSIFIASLDTHTINFLDPFKSNITAIRITDPTDLSIQSIVYDWEQHERRDGRYFKILPGQVKTKMVLANDAVLVFSKTLAALQITDRITVPKLNCKELRRWPFGRNIINSIKNSTIVGATGRIDFDSNGQRDFFNLQILDYSYMVKNFTEIATWNSINGIENIDGSQKRHDNIIANKVFLISSRIGEPFLFNRSMDTDEILYGNNRYEGYSMDLIDAIAKFIGFKYEFVIVEDYGQYEEETGKWNGIIREVMDGNVDMGICDLTMTAARRQVVDFTPPFMTVGITLMYSQPEKPKPNLFSFVDPFSKEVWIKIGFAFIGIFLFLIFSSRIAAPEDWKYANPFQPLDNYLSIKNTVWITVGSLMGQGGDMLPKLVSIRIIKGTWWFFLLMILNSYQANLTAFLQRSSNSFILKSVQHLANQNKIKYGVVDGGSTQAFFRDSNVSLYQKMWSTMQKTDPSVFADDNDEGEEMVVRSKRGYAFFMESSTLEYKIERNCQILQVGSWLDYKTYGIAMPFNSRYRKQISETILKLGESGVLADLKRKWWKEMGGGKCTIVSSVSSKNGPDPIDIKNVGGVFLVVAMGVFVAICVGILEFFWNLQKVSLDQKITLLKALKLETIFALKIWKQIKPVRTIGSRKLSTKRSSKSIKKLSSESSETKTKNRSLKSNRSLQGSSTVSIRSRKFLDVACGDDEKIDNFNKTRKTIYFSLKSQLNVPNLFNNDDKQDEINVCDLEKN